MVAEIKVSTWRKSPRGRNTNTPLPWGHVDVHSISQYSVDHRLPFVARRVDMMVPTRQLLRPAPPVSAQYLGQSSLRAWDSARPSSQHPSLRSLSVTGFSEDPGEAGSHTHATPRSCQDCVEAGFSHLPSRPALLFGHIMCSTKRPDPASQPSSSGTGILHPAFRSSTINYMHLNCFNAQ